ncbi:MAG: hypothetical protein KDE56_27740 [Anaerolineales bacterium]|nr:hypothetical protein [Anaerolineales bacterium]MCA9974263.1 hypothetical protein [Anaerolineales bacterium]MCA9999598.1 hypothetical protein [Anaerolineales bacterium]MCB8968175.1 hypothetical protein [Ardenticatenaceae bacterium]
MKKIATASVFLLSFITFVGIQSAYAAPTAYIDPNTGGMLFQILAVAFTLLSGVIFFFSSRIKMGFARLMRNFRKGEDNAQETAPDNE